MPNILLTTKFNIPTLRKDALTRPYLIAQLNEGLREDDPTRRSLTLLSAPAGFGKTTLVSQWLQQVDIPVAWLSLDEEDNDLVRFFTYLVEAIRRIDEHVGQSLFGILQSIQPPSPQSLVAALTSDLPQNPFILVLEDFHLLDDLTIIETVRYLLAHLPVQMHLVITTRKDPSLPLARLRAEGQLTEIRARDLRFSKEETARFLNEVMGLRLSVKDITTLEARTEGWIVGLHLAALSMYGYEDEVNRSKFIQTFAGDDRHVVDYLVSEVLSRQSEQVKNFLLTTAILNRFNSSLCDALADIPGSTAGSQEILEYLDKANLFLVPLDNQRRWYRYHHLFADLLRHRLYQTQPGKIAQLHLRACEWYARADLIHEAIHHALAAEDNERAASLIESVAVKLVIESRLSTLRSWMAKLPDDLIAVRPWLCVSGAWANLLSGHIDAVEPLLQYGEAILHELSPQTFPDYERIYGHMTAIRAFFARWQGDVQHSILYSQEALEHLPETSLVARSAVALNLGTAYALLGELKESQQFFEEACALGQQGGNYYAALTAISYLATIQTKKGHLHQAAKINRQAIQLGTEWGGGQPLPATGQAYLGLGRLFYEWNDLVEAQNNLRRGIELGEQVGEEFIVLGGALMLAPVLRAQGNEKAADEAFTRAQEIHSRSPRVQELGELSSAQARIWLRQGNLDAVNRWANERALQTNDELEYGNFGENLTLARVFIFQGEPDKAPGLLMRMLESAEASDCMGDAIEILVVEAMAFQAQGDTDRAMIAFERALSLAEDEGYVRTFVDEGPPLAFLLYEAARRGISPDYVGVLLAVFPQDEPAIASRSTIEGFPEEIIEPLSEREVEVLRLIAQGRSNREIAEELVIALDTAKGHTRKIYGKLDVHSRTEAVAKARAFGILNS